MTRTQILFRPCSDHALPGHFPDTSRIEVGMTKREKARVRLSLLAGALVILAGAVISMRLPEGGPQE